jgi:hypothetical protein
VPDLIPIRQSLRCALILGAVGFAAGFFGPLVLNPESNIGPVIGILISGPLGAIAGAMLGAIFGALSVGERRRRQLLTASSVALGVGTLYFCLPGPVFYGYVIDAEVAECASPAQGLDAAVATWDQMLAQVKWATPTANWQQIAAGNLEGDPGVVLTLHVRRRSAILRYRRPWDRNRMSAGPWIPVDESKQYYADDEGPGCQSYLVRPRQFYWPAIGSNAINPNAAEPQAARVWPPTDTLNFLRLQRLGPVPAQYQRLLDGMSHDL